MVNYRNEPLGLRGLDPATKRQTARAPGDLSLAMPVADRPRDRGARHAAAVYPALTADVEPGDPYTPLLRAYMGDQVRIRAQVGAHEEEPTTRSSTASSGSRTR